MNTSTFETEILSDPRFQNEYLKYITPKSKLVYPDTDLGNYFEYEKYLGDYPFTMSLLSDPQIERLVRKRLKAQILK